jgi:hypothetical protein
MKRIVQGLNIGNLSKSSRRTKDRDQFIELLQSQSNSVKVLSIVKNRQQNLLPVDRNLKYKGNKDLEKLVTIEVSHALSPEDVYTLSVHSSVDIVRDAIPMLMRNMDKRVYRRIIFTNYLKVVKIWGLGKKIFD